MFLHRATRALKAPQAASIAVGGPAQTHGLTALAERICAHEVSTELKREVAGHHEGEKLRAYRVAALLAYDAAEAGDLLLRQFKLDGCAGNIPGDILMPDEIVGGAMVQGICLDEAIT